MPDILPGQLVIRLIPSTTGRNITPNMLGKIGGLDPTLHNNRIEDWADYGFVPIQWQNGLWSNLGIEDRGYSWNYYPIPQDETEED